MEDKVEHQTTKSTKWELNDKRGIAAAHSYSNENAKERGIGV